MNTMVSRGELVGALVAPAFVRPAADCSAMLRPAVYVLRQRGRVVWVGRCKNPVSRLYAHAQHRRGRGSPGMPPRPVTFDTVELHNCLIDDLDALWARTCEALRWSP